MKLSKRTFRILLPSIYIVTGLSFVAGIIVTIAEAPNPLGFLFFASEPGLLLLDFIDRRLVHLPDLTPWGDMLFLMLVNVGIYFLVGWTLDVIINGYLKRQSRT